MEPLNVSRQMLAFQKQAVNNFQSLWDFRRRKRPLP